MHCAGSVKACGIMMVMMMMAFLVECVAVSVRCLGTQGMKVEVAPIICCVVSVRVFACRISAHLGATYV